MRISPETHPIITCIAPCAASATGDSGDSVNLEGYAGALVIIQHAGTSDNDMTFTIHEGATAAVAKTGTYPLAAESGSTSGGEFKIWKNLAVTVSDTLVKQTDGVSVLVDSDLGTNQLLVYYVSASCLTPGRNWINVGFDAGHASNFLCITYILDGGRYQQTTPPTAIV
jgi:hypothetical protein